MSDLTTPVGDRNPMTLLHEPSWRRLAHRVFYRKGSLDVNADKWWGRTPNRVELFYTAKSGSLKQERSGSMVTKEILDGLKAMSPEEIVTTIQVAGNDALFMSALDQKVVDNLVKQSIEWLSQEQEKTEQWPTFETWLNYRGQLIAAALKEATHVAGEIAP